MRTRTSRDAYCTRPTNPHFAFNRKYRIPVCFAFFRMAAVATANVLNPARVSDADASEKKTLARKRVPVRLI